LDGEFPAIQFGLIDIILLGTSCGDGC